MAGRDGGAGAGTVDLAPGGLTDLRGLGGPPLTVRYGDDAVVVVAGVPGSGKSTLLRRWAPSAETVDPRRTRLACEAVMPARLPYAVYRPWTRTLHLVRTRAAFRRPGPLLVHDCGSRRWMRRCLARWARRNGRDLHVVLLAVRPEEAVAGQRARNRAARAGTFRHHVQRIARLVDELDRHGARAFRGAASVLLADEVSRERLSTVRFDAVGSDAIGSDAVGSDAVGSDAVVEPGARAGTR